MTQKQNDSLIFNTTHEQFDREVIDASRHTPVLVDFWADWCPPCTMLTPILERVVLAYNGNFRLAKVEVDEGHNMKLAGKYSMRGFPTVLLFVDGEEKGRWHSAKPDHWVKQFLAGHGIAQPE
jgi:putative thioredoxin